ncbi:hypothetical protein DFA_05638 [Cavenderia fasciculata]|uniref:Tetratricopeptide-like helical domain-containing protein n=1 Tax=Cavenderia fasciculata TaxID=261658 RepID=F4PLV1_CACFS|nr:uncharacterized protein DFA_05638 [Cavenderia fasciculata]EGG23505.1 hypothetical protein DFA_05638 [Cavenderia fasciculata]|eukprot:XP_004361356.1 hypothetical protein DFA_05638 [Cavenderia fasciculata]
MISSSVIQSVVGRLSQRVIISNSNNHIIKRGGAWLSSLASTNHVSTRLQSKYLCTINNNSFFIGQCREYSSSSSSASSSSRNGGIDKRGSLVQENYNVMTLFSFKTDQIVKQADAHYRNRQYQDAVTYYEKAISSTNDPIECSLLQSRIASAKFRGGLLSEAMNHFHTATKSIPYSHEETYKILAQGAFMLEFDFDLQVNKESKESQTMLARASTAWDAVIDCAPNKPDGYVGKGRCILKMSKPQLVDAMRYSQKAISLDHNYPPVQSFASEMLVIENKELLALQLLNKFFKNYKQFYEDSFIYKIDNSTIGDNYFRRGLCYLHEQQPDKAVLDFTEALNYLQEEEHPSVKFFRGRCYYAIQKYRAALEDFNTFIKYNPKHIAAYEERRDVYSMLGMHEHAEKDQKIVQKDREKKHDQRLESIQMYNEERLERIKRRNEDIAEKKRIIRMKQNEIEVADYKEKK